MSTVIAQEYLCIGGNRHSAASEWSKNSGLLAFGADQNVAICTLLNKGSATIQELCHGHTDKVTSLAFLHPSTTESREVLVSGSADGKLLTRTVGTDRGLWHVRTETDAHQGAVNCIAALPGSSIFVTGGADCKIKVWSINDQNVSEVLTIVPKPRLIPLALVLGPSSDSNPATHLFLAVGGTRNDVLVYALKDLLEQPSAQHQATLTGHEGWIRSLSLKIVNERQLLLASASHDKYVRLWRFDLDGVPSTHATHDLSQGTSFERTLVAKAQTVTVGDRRYSITFEALLLGHEDWIYSTCWNPVPEAEQLLTTSADGTLTIWESDPTSGIWISAFKLGEISGQKGATTATGSSGGFWVGVWSPDGQSVACLGRTGSWRIWHFNESERFWVQQHGIGGHTAAVNGLAWSPTGSYFLSTSSDQTTRLHAAWKRGDISTWHEFSRPQIHGYDLNCVSAVDDSRFVSGADEKLLRVFNEPRQIADVLERLCGIQLTNDKALTDVAAIPVLGLSNKAMTTDDERQENDDAAPAADISVAQISSPPTEDLLSRHTLWPEHEKLYGHGYEISQCAYSSTNQVLATTCKASSADHAVIRLYDTNTWNEIKPPLTAHSLTVTRLAWSWAPDNYLLSVGRDRQWFVFKREAGDRTRWSVMQSNAKAHTRMILDAAWSPIGGRPFFATAGRDKVVKIWGCKDREDPDDDPVFYELSSIKRDSAVTAVDFTCCVDEQFAVLAVGEESGTISIHVFHVDHSTRPLSSYRSIVVDGNLSPSKAITRLAWRPDSRRHSITDRATHLAVAAADGSVRLLRINVENLCR